MDFDFTTEQVQLADAVRRLVEKDYGFETRQRIVRSTDGSGDEFWARLVELGLTALPMPEDAGGFAGTAVDLLPVMQELGRGLVAEPFFATILAAEFVKRSPRVDASLLVRVADGSLKMAAALGEKASRHDPFVVATRAVRTGDGFELSGQKSVVLFGAQADCLVVSARLSAGDDGIALFVVDPAVSGVTRSDRRTLDGQRVSEVVLERVVVGRDALFADGRAARELIDAVVDYGIALLSAEAIGAMEALNAATLEYAKTRKQFGQPIARFQVLQHRMVDMFMHLEQARSMAYLAAARAGSADARERGRVASAAKVRIGQAARFIGQQAVQIHGGMGVTNELPAAHLFKRLTMIEMTLGDTDHHLQRFIALSQDGVERATVREPLQRAA
jgi:alkylation response protein AidB-like acyl-CoA dehydrogenase